MDVRATYCDTDFEWDQLKKLATNDTKAANTKLMRSFATASLQAQLTEPAASAEGSLSDVGEPGAKRGSSDPSAEPPAGSQGGSTPGSGPSN